MGWGGDGMGQGMVPLSPNLQPPSQPAFNPFFSVAYDQGLIRHHES